MAITVIHSVAPPRDELPDERRAENLLACGLCALTGQAAGLSAIAVRETPLHREHYEHLRRKREVATELKPLFERESGASESAPLAF